MDSRGVMSDEIGFELGHGRLPLSIHSHMGANDTVGDGLKMDSVTKKMGRIELSASGSDRSDDDSANISSNNNSNTGDDDTNHDGSFLYGVLMPKRVTGVGTTFSEVSAVSLGARHMSVLVKPNLDSEMDDSRSRAASFGSADLSVYGADAGSRSEREGSFGDDEPRPQDRATAQLAIIRKYPFVMTNLRKFQQEKRSEKMRQSQILREVQEALQHEKRTLYTQLASEKLLYLFQSSRVEMFSLATKSVKYRTSLNQVFKLGSSSGTTNPSDSKHSHRPGNSNSLIAAYDFGGFPMITAGCKSPEGDSYLLFCGREYTKIDILSRQPLPGFPRSVTRDTPDWKNLPKSFKLISAVACYQGHLYLFCKRRFCKLANDGSKKVIAKGRIYPRNFRGVEFSTIDAAFAYGSHMYFFHKTKFIKWSFITRKPVLGYPKKYSSSKEFQSSKFTFLTAAFVG